MARNRRHSSWLIVATFAVSVLAHPAGAWLYEVTRSVADPSLRVVKAGDGSGVVISVPEGISCGEDCEMSGSQGSLVKLTATIAEGSTFRGWQGPCGSQDYKLFGWAGQLLFPGGEPQAIAEGQRELFEFLSDAAEQPLAEYPLECEVFLDTRSEVVASFGVQPKSVEVAMLTDPSPQDPDEAATLSLPMAQPLPEEILDLTEEIKKIAETEPEPVPPVIVPLPKPVVTAKPSPPAPKIAEAPKMKAVEVPDDNEVAEAPDDAHFLSDKNRDVEKETRATETNLDKQRKGERVASAQSDLESKEVGADKEQIAQLDDVEETSLDADRSHDKAVGKESVKIVERASGEEGDRGQEGESGDGSPSKKPGLLAMRNIEGRGALGGVAANPSEVQSDMGAGGQRGRRGKKGAAGPNLRFAQADYERIVGKQLAESERLVSRRKQSRRKGRWERKMGMLKSALENFTPEVHAGNQTALKTRAAPFALYIARMHRRIHELWGFGFLEELERKSSSNELNNWSLVTKLEIVINPDGSIDKMTIVNPSGVLSFDVAALDVVDTAGPYESTPRQIRSPDGKVYMHWSFHRDWRQCGTFGAEPFILSTAPHGADRGFDDSKLLRNVGSRKRKTPSARSSSASPASEAHSAAAARANASLPAPGDPAAQHVANLWLSAFVAGDAGKLASLSASPFHSGGRVVAKSSADIRAIYKVVIGELPSRRIRDWKVLSAAGYRKNFGMLPAGLEVRGPELFLVVLLRGDQLTLVLESSGRSYRVRGLYR